MESLPLNAPSPDVSYSLALSSVSELAAYSDKLVCLSGTEDMGEDESKDLTNLIIQEHLEEHIPPAAPPSGTRPTFSKPSDSQPVYAMNNGPQTPQEHGCLHSPRDMDEDKTILTLCESDTSSPVTTDDGNLVILNVGEDGERQVQDVAESCPPVQHPPETGYLVYNPSDQTLRIASPRVTPLLVLASNTGHGTYEANVVLNQSTELGEHVNLNSPTIANTNADPTTITMMVDGDTKLLFDGQHTSGQLLYMCDIPQCGAVFGSIENFRQHQEWHVAKAGTSVTNDCGSHNGRYSRQLVCSHYGCSRTFAWPTHLKYHELTHTGKRMFRCEVEGCGASFYTVQRLTVHRRVHTGERPFVCTEANCNKSFTTHGNLKNHSRVHTGEKPYGCDFQGCSKRFAEHSSLRKHGLLHTGMKPYECDICGKKFSQSGSRNVHMKRHQALNEERSLETESVVFSNTVTDHVVTVTTQPAEEGNSQRGSCKSEELCKQEEQSHTRILTSTAGANVVVLSQPEEMVAMAPGYHHAGEENPKDMVYACQQLLNVDVS